MVDGRQVPATVPIHGWAFLVDVDRFLDFPRNVTGLFVNDADIFPVYDVVLFCLVLPYS